MKTQLSLNEQLRKRLEERKQSLNLPQTISKSLDSTEFPSFQITHENPEDLRKDIRLVCTLYLKFHSPLYINYMARGFALFRGTINTDADGYKKFCNFGFPSICVCGVVQAFGGCAIIHGCRFCKKSPDIFLEYEISQLSRKFNIHDSWLRFGFACALHCLNGYK